MRSFLKYPSYQSSGVEWLGDVPSHWNIKRLKYNFRLKAEKAVTDDNPVALENIESWTGRFFSTNSEFEGNGITFKEGDILFGKLRPYLAKVFLATENGEAIGDLFVMSPHQTVCPKFSAYLFRTKDFIEIVDGSTFGSKMPRASWDFMGNLPFLLPPIPEQEAIAAFLDRETERIDGLIAKREKLIELMQEKRAAVISHAVTKGLNSDAKMKPSGIDWLGDIPEHWEVKKLSYICTMRSGNTITSEEFDCEGEYPVYGGNGFRGYYSKYTHDGFHVLIGRQGALCGNINYASGKFWASEHAVVVSCASGISTFWLGELLRNMNLNQYSITAAQPGLSVDLVLSKQIPFPPFEEQAVIAEYIKKHVTHIDGLIEKGKQVIERTKEYRAALISAAVTGKIDVRESV